MAYRWISREKSIILIQMLYDLIHPSLCCNSPHRGNVLNKGRSTSGSSILNSEQISDPSLSVLFFCVLFSDDLQKR